MKVFDGQNYQILGFYPIEAVALHGILLDFFYSLKECIQKYIQ